MSRPPSFSRALVSLLILSACGENSLPAESTSSTPEVMSGPPGVLKRGTFSLFGKPVELAYEDVNGQAMLEGDILLPPPERGLDTAGSSGPRAQGAAIHPSTYWPGGVVPFVIDPGLPAQDRVWNAIREWQNQTNVRFVSRTNEPNYVRFVRGSGCSSYIGRINGEQAVTLEDACSTGNAIHEIGHAVGLFHEQSRTDRDNYIVIHWENITPAYQHNFQRYVDQGYSGSDQGAYDLRSIMHYPPNAFSSNGLATISTRSGAPFNANREILSAGDINAAVAMYGARGEHPCGYLGVNESLYPGQQVRSCNGRAQFVHQGDGNVVLYRNDGRVLWHSHTYGQSNASLAIQDDCNVVIYSNGAPVWYTGTGGCGG